MMVLSIDYGTSHIGLAIGDSEVLIALPYKTISHKSRQDLFDEIVNIIKVENIHQLVVGEPLVAHTATPGYESSLSAVHDFVTKLGEATQLPVEMVDERFSTEQAKQLQQAGSKISDHELSAMLILQSYFDTIKPEKT